MENRFLNLNGMKFGKTFKNFTRRFRRNLDMGIFLNSSRLGNDIKKIKYVMP
jgi:hypothetical protein